ncbi:MAG: hypothetical protein IGQ45_03185 [Cyanobacterium sp. T60_A2020_053]|nr:hypothetical protein [Cyanobacterium sp. T60_A2020_053]
MSSSSPYKSRLFSFLNRQYIKLNDSFGIKFRQLQQVVNTGIATIIYPFYLLLQTTQNLSKALQSNFSNEVNNILVLPSCDQIIEDVAKEIIKYPQIQQLNLNKIQGLASILSTKEIVLVKKNKEIIKVFSSQGEIKAIIRSARHRYWQNKRFLQLQSTSPKTTKKLSRGVNLFSFIRFFTAKNNISNKLNQQNNSLLTNQVNLTENNKQKLNGLILFIDNFLAKFDSNSSQNSLSQQSVNKEVLTNSETKKQSILGIIQSAIAYFFGFNSKNNSLKEKSYNNQLASQENKPSNQLNPAPFTDIILSLAEKTQQKTAEIIPVIQNAVEGLMVQGLKQVAVVKNQVNNLIGDENDPYQIQHLIWMAIDYFFNVKLQQKTKYTFSHQEEKLLLIDGEIADPWLSWQDLYGDNQSILSANNTANITINNINNFIPDTTVEGAGLLKNEEKKKINIVNKISVSNKTQKHEKNSNHVAIVEKISDNKPTSQEIEATVISIEYEKHLLEIILEKIDQFIAWLENIFIKIIEKLKRVNKAKEQEKI